MVGWLGDGGSPGRGGEERKWEELFFLVAEGSGTCGSEFGWTGSGAQAF